MDDNGDIETSDRFVWKAKIRVDYSEPRIVLEVAIWTDYLATGEHELRVCIGPLCTDLVRAWDDHKIVGTFRELPAEDTFIEIEVEGRRRYRCARKFSLAAVESLEIERVDVPQEDFLYQGESEKNLARFAGVTITDEN